MCPSWHELYGIQRQDNRHPLVEELLLEALVPAAQCAAGRLLDVGCGAKPYAPLFAAKVDSHVGLDLATSPHDQSTVDIYADAASLPFADNSFDTVLCTEVLEHLPEPCRAIDELHRVLKPNGRIILTCCQTFQLHEQPRDFYRFTRFGLAHLLSRFCDLEIETLVPVGGTLDFAVYFVSATMLGLLPRLLGGTFARKVVCALQAGYLRIRGDKPGSEWFCFGHLAIVRKVAAQPQPSRAA